MQRRRFFAALFGLIATMFGRPALSRGAEIADLEEQLNDDLLVRMPQDRAFVREVVRMVKNDELPRSMVDSTHLWARRKQRYAIQYFENALRARAKKLGIVIIVPAYDNAQ